MSRVLRQQVNDAWLSHLMRPGFCETGSARFCELAGVNNIPQSINGDGAGRGRGGTSVSQCLSPQ